MRRHDGLLYVLQAYCAPSCRKLTPALVLQVHIWETAPYLHFLQGHITAHIVCCNQTPACAATPDTYHDISAPV
jgi:hypothetical protein